MSKSYKLKDGNYIDSTGIVHNRKLLSEILTILTRMKFEDYVTGKDLNTENGLLTIFSYAMPTNVPSNFAGWGVGVCFGNASYRTQILVGNYNYTNSDTGKRIAIRSSTNSGSTWTNWHLI